MIFHRIILVVLYMCVAQAVLAQGSTIKASVDKDKILIGEPLLLTVEANFPEGVAIFFPKSDSIDHFEFLEKPVFDTTGNTATIIKGVYKITSFDSGHWIIPSFILSDDIKTDTIPVDVVFSEFNPQQDYHDIKDVLDIRPKQKNDWWYIAAGSLVLLALLLYLLLRKKKPQTAPKPAIVINAYDEAIKNLEMLRKNKPGAREYYSKLTDIFRLYIFRKKGILSLQKTTDDLMVQLKTIGLAREEYDQLSQSLRLSDFVKFAKFAPTDSDDEKAYGDILNTINSIEKMEVQAAVKKS
jgi:LPXTG-motif cell wall-anchored protein